MQRTAFSLAVLISLGLAGLIGLMVGLMALRLNFLLPGPFAQMTHFTEAHHRIHDLTFSFLLGTAAVGLVAQLRTPSKNVASQLMALIPFVGLVLVVVLTNTQVLQIPWIAVGATTILATTLHPTGLDLFRSFRVARVNRVMLALVVTAAVPLLAYAVTNIGLERTVADDHAASGHYGFLAAFSFTVIGVSLLASMRPDGWRLTAWVAGILPVLFGLASVVFPDAASSLELVWALVAMAWGLVFVGVAEFTRVTQPAEPFRDLDTGGNTSPGPGRTSTARTSPAAVVAGLLVIVLVLLFAFMHLAGGGPGLHAAPTGRQAIPTGGGG